MITVTAQSGLSLESRGNSTYLSNNLLGFREDTNSRNSFSLTEYTCSFTSNAISTRADEMRSGSIIPENISIFFWEKYTENNEKTQQLNEKEEEVKSVLKERDFTHSVVSRLSLITSISVN